MGAVDRGPGWWRGVPAACPAVIGALDAHSVEDEDALGAVRPAVLLLGHKLAALGPASPGSTGRGKGGSGRERRGARCATSPCCHVSRRAVAMPSQPAVRHHMHASAASATGNRVPTRAAGQPKPLASPSSEARDLDDHATRKGELRQRIEVCEAPSCPSVGNHASLRMQGAAHADHAIHGP